jgi:hypothetical protein
MSYALEIKLLLDTGELNLRKVCADAKTAAAIVEEVCAAISKAEEYCLLDQMDRTVLFPISRFVGIAANIYSMG